MSKVLISSIKEAVGVPRRFGDIVFKQLTMVCAVFVLLLIVAMGWQLTQSAMPAVKLFGFDFFQARIDAGLGLLLDDGGILRGQTATAVFADLGFRHHILGAVRAAHMRGFQTLADGFHKVLDCEVVFHHQQAKGQQR